MAFTYVADGIDDVLAAHLNQYADAWTGVSGKGQPFNAVAVNDPINFAISARNLDPTNSRAAQFLKADGTVLFQCDASGVKVSPDGTVASVPVTATSTQTLTNKTFTAPVVNAGLQVASGNIGVGIAPAANAGIFASGAILSGGTTQYSLVAQAAGSSAGTVEISGVLSGPATAAAAFTVTTVADFHAQAPSKGAGSTITSAYGLLVDGITSGNTNNYGVRILAPSGGTGQNIGLYNDGSAAVNGAGTTLSFFAGVLAVKQTVTGAKGGNAALGSLLTALAAYGLITDSSTA